MAPLRQLATSSMVFMGYWGLFRQDLDPLASMNSLTAPVGFCTTTSELTHSVGSSCAQLLLAFPSFLVP